MLLFCWTIAASYSILYELGIYIASQINHGPSLHLLRWPKQRRLSQTISFTTSSLFFLKQVKREEFAVSFNASDTKMAE